MIWGGEGGDRGVWGVVIREDLPSGNEECKFLIPNGNPFLPVGGVTRARKNAKLSLSFFGNPEMSCGGSLVRELHCKRFVCWHVLRIP